MGGLLGYHSTRGPGWRPGSWPPLGPTLEDGAGKGTLYRFGHVTQALNRSRDPETRVSWRGHGTAGFARPRAVIAVVAGGSMLVAPTIPPSTQASMLYTVKILMSVAGFVILCLGALMYLYLLVRDRTEAAARSRRGSDRTGRAREVWEKPT